MTAQDWSLRVLTTGDEDGGYLVTAPGILCHGFGATPDAARADFIVQLDDLYAELVRDEAALGPGLAAQLATLRRARTEHEEDEWQR